MGRFPLFEVDFGILLLSLLLIRANIPIPTPTRTIVIMIPNSIILGPDGLPESDIGVESLGEI